MSYLKDKVIIITGASRGVGKAIALRCARDGAIVVIAARTEAPHPLLEGSIYLTAKEVEEAGGIAFPVCMDISKEESVLDGISKIMTKLGRIDVLINNASIIYLSPTLATPMKRFDLMSSVIVRGTFLCSQACIPYLKNASNPHILNIVPPLNLNPKWFKDHVAYTMLKYCASLCTLGLSEELKYANICVNALWPKITVATSTIKIHMPKIWNRCRKTDIMGDAAYEIITDNTKILTGNFFLDEDILRLKGITDFSSYAIDPLQEPCLDLYVDN